jgi:hypothetical protein
MTSSIDFSKLSDEEVGKLFLQALQVYEDQISIMDFVRKKTTEVRNDIHDLEIELTKRNVQIKSLEEENE